VTGDAAWRSISAAAPAVGLRAMTDAALDGLTMNPALPEPLVRRLIARRRGVGRVAARPDLPADLIDGVRVDDT
jgi:hypothetical protein